MGGGRRVLITGASGFIGGRLARHLLERGFEVRGTGRNRMPFEKLGLEGASFFTADLTEDDSLDGLVDGCEIIVHAAARSEAFGPRELFEAANVRATERLLEAAKRRGVKRFVFLSSPSIYFGGRDVIGATENSPPGLLSDPYAQTKRIADEYVLAQNGRGIETISLRPRMVTGAADDKFFPRFVEAMDSGKLKQLKGHDPLVHITAIENLLDALLLAIDADASLCGATYNIANADPVRLFTMLEILAELTGRPFEPGTVPFPLAYAAASVVEGAYRLFGRTDDPPLFRLQIEVLRYSLTLDISAARTKLGYEPTVDNQETLERFAKWYCEARA